MRLGVLQPAAQAVRHAELIVEKAHVLKRDLLILAAKLSRLLVLWDRFAILPLIEQAVAEIKVNVPAIGEQCRELPEVTLRRGKILFHVGCLGLVEVLPGGSLRSLRIR